MENESLKYVHPHALEILKYLLDTTTTTTSANNSTPPSQSEQPPRSPVPLVNHRNNAGNTPLHWAALNTHLNCVKALVEAGADISAKNNAGHDAAFLAERTGWKLQTEGEDANADVADVHETPDTEMSPGLEVAEWLLGRDTRTGSERMGGGEGSRAGNESEDEVLGDEMGGVIQTSTE
jgi:hypothetical protein